MAPAELSVTPLAATSMAVDRNGERQPRWPSKSAASNGACGKLGDLDRARGRQAEPRPMQRNGFAKRQRFGRGEREIAARRDAPLKGVADRFGNIVERGKLHRRLAVDERVRHGMAARPRSSAEPP